MFSTPARPVIRSSAARAWRLVSWARYGLCQLEGMREPAERAFEFDSRAVTPGGLFLALPGARSDGHDFAAGLAFPLFVLVAEGSTRRTVAPPSRVATEGQCCW